MNGLSLCPQLDKGLRGCLINGNTEVHMYCFPGYEKAKL